MVRSNNGTSRQLNVGVSGPDDTLCCIVDDCECCEAIPGAELTTPSTGYGVGTTRDTIGRSLAGRATRDSIGARSGCREVGIDREGPCTRGIGGVTDSLHALDCPLRFSGPDAVNIGRGCWCCKCGVGQYGRDESSSELHVDGVF